jgi:hypothetical protein
MFGNFRSLNPRLPEFEGFEQPERVFHIRKAKHSRCSSVAQLPSSCQ